MFKIVRVSPSIIAIDYKNKETLNKNLKLLEKSLASFVHLDVMDGKFVKAKTFDNKLVEYVKNNSNLLLDVHLMVENPEKVISNYINAGADILSVHFEATNDIKSILKTIRSKNVLAGVVINPKTPVSSIKELIIDNLVDVVVVMGVEAGAYGQEFIPGSAEKVAEVRELSKSVLIEIDGGVTIKNSKILRKLGVDIIVSGATIFNAKNINKTIRELKGNNYLERLKYVFSKKNMNNNNN